LGIVAHRAERGARQRLFYGGNPFPGTTTTIRFSRTLAAKSIGARCGRVTYLCRRLSEKALNTNTASVGSRLRPTILGEQHFSRFCRRIIARIQQPHAGGDRIARNLLLSGLASEFADWRGWAFHFYQSRRYLFSHHHTLLFVVGSAALAFSGPRSSALDCLPPSFCLPRITNLRFSANNQANRQGCFRGPRPRCTTRTKQWDVTLYCGYPKRSYLGEPPRQRAGLRGPFDLITMTAFPPAPPLSLPRSWLAARPQDHVSIVGLSHHRQATFRLCGDRLSKPCGFNNLESDHWCNPGPIA